MHPFPLRGAAATPRSAATSPSAPPVVVIRTAPRRRHSGVVPDARKNSREPSGGRADLGTHPAALVGPAHQRGGSCAAPVRGPLARARGREAAGGRPAPVGPVRHGDGRFREGLGVLVDAFNARDDAPAFARIVFSDHVVSLLVNRLKIQADLTRHPEILDVPLARPLFIAGLPRSGTTFLHRLMSEDPAGRTLRTCEGWMPSPPPTYETYRTDPRIALRRRQDDLANRLSPRLAMAHEVAAESPEEA